MSTLQETLNHRSDAASLGSLRRRLAEAYDELLGSFVDPDEAFYDRHGVRWTELGVATSGGRARAIGTAEQLRAVREECRHLAATNEFAINGHENRISYIIGSGHTYRATARKDRDAQADLPAQVQTVLDEFLEENAWSQRQREIVLRLDRDGEAFLRLFVDSQGATRVRFVEPDQIATPTERADDPAASFGIQTDRDDVESPLAYWIDGQSVDAAGIQHRKANVDSNVKRGLPLFYPVRKNLRRAEKLLRNMSVVAEIQSAIALIRKHRAASRSGVEQFAAAGADATRTNPATGRTALFRRYAPGTIVDAPSGTEYEFPASGVDAANFVTVLQAELRAIASRLVMPEFMLTSDASNANFASTMVAEGPAIKMFARLQAEQIAFDRQIMRRVVEAAVAAGRLPAESSELVEIQTAAPSLCVRDALAEAQVARIQLQAGILSPQTWSTQAGLDYDQEQANRRVHGGE